MSLQSEVVNKTYSGNGSSTNFSFPYKLLDSTDLDVYLVDNSTLVGTLKSFVTDYDVIGLYNPSTNDYDDFSEGASVNFVSAPSSSVTVVIIRNNPDTQDVSPTKNAAYNSSDIEYILDKIVMMVQYVLFKVKRSVAMSDSNINSTFDPTLPNNIVADSTLAISSDGKSLTMGPTTAYITTAVTAAATSATAAATSASAASSSASAASTSASAASTSATAAASSATAAASSATAAAASATTASSAATTSVAAYLGIGYILETTFNIANNQSSAANVTGLLFDPTQCRSVEIDVQIYRNTTSTGATELSARAKYIATYKTVANSWDLTLLGVGGDVDATSGEPGGVTLSITTAGQVQYASTNISGTAASSVAHFRANCLGV